MMKISNNIAILNMEIEKVKKKILCSPCSYPKIKRGF